MTVENATVNERLQGLVVVTCPRGCGATLRVPAVFYSLNVRDESGAGEIPVEVPDLPAALLLHWINCPNALSDDGIDER